MRYPSGASSNNWGVPDKATELGTAVDFRKAPGTNATAWDSGDYVPALEGFKAVLAAPGGDEYFEPIALATGDGASTEKPGVLTLTAGEASEAILFDLM